MASKKIYTKLPAVLQTTAIKNFFESTVEQMFSKANTESINGFVGNYSFEDYRAAGTFIPEASATRRFYSLAPVANTINPDTGESENLIFFDEMIDTLATYGVDVRNQKVGIVLVFVQAHRKMRTGVGLIERDALNTAP